MNQWQQFLVTLKASMHFRIVNSVFELYCWPNLDLMSCGDKPGLGWTTWRCSACDDLSVMDNHQGGEGVTLSSCISSLGIANLPVSPGPPSNFPYKHFHLGLLMPNVSVQMGTGVCIWTWPQTRFKLLPSFFFYRLPWWVTASTTHRLWPRPTSASPSPRAPTSPLKQPTSFLSG